MLIDDETEILSSSKEWLIDSDWLILIVLIVGLNGRLIDGIH